jgi:hypothetical protein
VAWPALAILLFGVHQLLVRRSMRSQTGRPGPTGMRLRADAEAEVSRSKE